MTQGQVWDEIRKAGETLGTRSMSGALNEHADQMAEGLAAWAAAFPWQEGQVGVLALIAGRALALDVIGDPSLYRRVHARLMMGYAMDALSEPDAPAAEGGAEAGAFLDGALGARRTTAPTAGAGTYQVLSGRVVGAELSDRGHLVHLSAFPAPEPRGGPLRTEGMPITPPSRRRGRGPA